MEALGKIIVALPNEKRSQSLVYFDYQNVNSPSSPSCMMRATPRDVYSVSHRVTVIQVKLLERFFKAVF